MAHDKVYGVCENKCFVEVPTKEQIDNEITDLNDNIKDVADNVLEVIDLDDDETKYVISIPRFNLGSTGRKLIRNLNANNVQIKVEFYVIGRAGTTGYLFCSRNGTIETKSGTSTSNYGSEPFIYSKVTIDWFTVNAGDRAIAECFEVYK